MTTSVRRLQPGEEKSFVRSVMVPFLDPPTSDPEGEKSVDRRVPRVEAERSFVAESNGRFVGNSSVYTMDLTVPSGPEGDCPVVAMAGVTAVGVHPTHRRRGVLTQMMAMMLSDARERAEPLAGLVASESVIYGRFGFGHATSRIDLTIDSRMSAYLRPSPVLDLELIDAAQAAKTLPPLFERHRRTRPGDTSRSALEWQSIFEDPPSNRGGGRGQFFAACESGYVRYRAHDGDLLHGQYDRVAVEELRGLTPEIEAALWRFVLDLDLVGTVTAKRRPIDDPLRWRLADPRQLNATRVDDFLWLRILDVPAALQARGYRRAGRLVLDLLGPKAPEAGDPAVGRWVLEADRDGSTCRPARPGEATDLRMEITDLGSLYLGGVSCSVLAAGGRVQELTDGSLDMADALFGAPLAPYTGTGF